MMTPFRRYGAFERVLQSYRNHARRLRWRVDELASKPMLSIEHTFVLLLSNKCSIQGGGMDTESKLRILADAAKYDVACTSSGLDRQARPGKLGNAVSAGICHSFSADGRCITLLKVLYTNACVYDCAYCVNRRSNDVPRAVFDPREPADLVIAFYRRNYIEGLFLSSGVTSTRLYVGAYHASLFAYCARSTAFTDTSTPRQSRGLPRPGCPAWASCG